MAGATVGDHLNTRVFLVAFQLCIWDGCSQVGNNSVDKTDVSPNDLTREVELYNSELLAILDNHAPLATQQVTIRPAAPWYTDKI